MRKWNTWVYSKLIIYSPVFNKLYFFYIWANGTIINYWAFCFKGKKDNSQRKFFKEHGNPLNKSGEQMPKGCRPRAPLYEDMPKSNNRRRQRTPQQEASLENLKAGGQ